MSEDKFKLSNKQGYFSLFKEIFKQERSGKNKDIIAIEKRKEELLKEEAIDLIDASALRNNLNSRLFFLDEKIENHINVRHFANKNAIELPKLENSNNSRLDFLDPDDKIQYVLLKSELNKSDEELIKEEAKRITHRPEKTNEEYLEMRKSAKAGSFKKWGSISYRGIGAAIGATIGGVSGTLLFPGAGTSVGLVLGASLGSIVGLVVFGIASNTFIVNTLTPFSVAYKQASVIKKIRKKEKQKRINQPLLLQTESRNKKALNKKAEDVILAAELQNIFKQVKAYILEKKNTETYPIILAKFQQKFITHETPIEKRALFFATIDNTLVNYYNKEYNYNAFIESIITRQKQPLETVKKTGSNYTASPKI